MTEPTPQQLKLMSAIEEHQVGPSPIIARDEAEACIGEGWLVKTSDGYELTDKGRSALEANR